MIAHHFTRYAFCIVLYFNHSENTFLTVNDYVKISDGVPKNVVSNEIIADLNPIIIDVDCVSNIIL